MDEETVLTIEAEGMPVHTRYRPGSFEAPISTSTCYGSHRCMRFTFLGGNGRRCLLRGWSRLGLGLAWPSHGLLFCGDACHHPPV